MSNYIVLKLIGLSILTMIVLVMISFVEVAIFSYFINPDQDMIVYEAHAEVSAPYISGIFGFIIFFLITRYWKKKDYDNILRLTFLFPLTYILLDILIITTAGVQWSEFILIFFIANSAKFLGSYLGFRLIN